MDALFASGDKQWLNDKQTHPQQHHEAMKMLNEDKSFERREEDGIGSVKSPQQDEENSAGDEARTRVARGLNRFHIKSLKGVLFKSVAGLNTTSKLPDTPCPTRRY
jgi:hypothetical protein